MSARIQSLSLAQENTHFSLTGQTALLAFYNLTNKQHFSIRVTGIPLEEDPHNIAQCLDIAQRKLVEFQRSRGNQIYRGNPLCCLGNVLFDVDWTESVAGQTF